MANKKLDKGASIAKTPVKKEVKTIDLKSIQLENQELKKQLEELKKLVQKTTQEVKPKSYEEQIKYFEAQKEIIKYLKIFEEHKILVEETLKEVSTITNNGEFESKVYRLSLTSENGKKKDIFNISNTIIIKNAMEFINSAIDNKIKALQQNLTL